MSCVVVEQDREPEVLGTEMALCSKEKESNFLLRQYSAKTSTHYTDRAIPPPKSRLIIKHYLRGITPTGINNRFRDTGSQKLHIITKFLDFDHQLVF
jgi:hypothetical protein